MAQQINLSQFDAITFHFDGNNNDPDDIAALPIAAALAKSAGLEKKTTFFYGNNLSEPNSNYQVNAMREGSAFAEKLGIKTHSYQDGIQKTTNELVKILDSGKKVLAIEGGPMEAIYRALEQTSPANRSNLTLLSHSSWNEDRNVGSRPGGGKPRTWDNIKADFPGVKTIDITDQNGPGNRGFNSANWNWLDNTNNPVLKEARDKMQNARNKVNDPSDAGMLFYAITNNENGDPGDAKAFFDANPPTFSPSPNPSPTPTPSPAPTPGGNQTVFLAEQGQVVIEAENTKLQGDWEKVTVDGKQSVLWDANQNSYGQALPGQTLSYSFETDEAGQYRIAMNSARLKSAMNASDSTRGDTGNDVFVSIIDEGTGQVVQKPTKLFTNLGSSDGDLRWGDTFDANHQKSPAQVGLKANTQYRLEVSGRSDGYVLDRITLSNDGFLKDAAIAESKTKGNSPNPSPGPTPTPSPTPSPIPTPNNSITIEAEDMKLSGEYRVESIDAASGKEAISLRGGMTEGMGTAAFNFNGPSGNYDIKVTYFDESDGVGAIKLKQGNQQIAAVDLDQQLGSVLADSKTLTTAMVKGVSINSGDGFTLTGIEDGTAKTAEHTRIDKVEFIPVASEAIRINAGGSALTDSSGAQWSADKFAQAGNIYSTTVGIDRTQDDPLFQTERFGKHLDYDIPVANGDYTVNLSFAEIYWNQGNQRVFDVKAENKLVLDNFDIHVGAGGKNVAMEKSFGVNVQDGMLNLDLTANINNAKISGIEIIPN